MPGLTEWFQSMQDRIGRLTVALDDALAKAEQAKKVEIAMRVQVTGAATRAELAEGRMAGLERIVTGVIRALPDYSDHPLGVVAAVEAKVTELEATRARLTQEIAEREAAFLPFAEAYARPIQASLAAVHRRALQAEADVGRLAAMTARAEKAEAICNGLMNKDRADGVPILKAQLVDAMTRAEKAESNYRHSEYEARDRAQERDYYQTRAMEMRAALLEAADELQRDGSTGLAEEIRHVAGEDLLNLRKDKRP